MVMIVPSPLTVIMLDDGARGGRTVHTSVFQDRERKAMTESHGSSLKLRNATNCAIAISVQD
jgi:hypothetical protein